MGIMVQVKKKLNGHNNDSNYRDDNLNFWFQNGNFRNGAWNKLSFSSSVIKTKMKFSSAHRVKAVKCWMFYESKEKVRFHYFCMVKLVKK